MSSLAVDEEEMDDDDDDEDSEIHTVVYFWQVPAGIVQNCGKKFIDELKATDLLCDFVMVVFVNQCVIVLLTSCLLYPPVWYICHVSTVLSSWLL